ncbi:mannose-6-phosphate isomerase, class I [Cumulibacter soli]|uniref:mannose-6-phosphate isomerase, class I n=1 Tax=Cumulibacter soli TaxID=2546344 RepID=UPI0010674011|nr:mannose-6-phosphate isomerase, class I [Cumulibacter soli]
MYRLENEIRNYAWGSRKVIADLLGRDDADRPEAELWLGAHPLGSSRIADCDGSPTLKHEIELDPDRHLGEAVHAEFPSRLPFLFKVLAADRPLSLQAHPNAARARAGFAAEEAAGIPIDDPMRSYRDSFDKPELFVALVPCEVLCGFREAAQAADILARLGISQLGPYIASLLTGRASDGLRVVVTTLLSLPSEAKANLAGQVIEECRRILGSDEPGPHARAYYWAVRLGEAYPGDIGVVMSLLLNLIELQPDQAIFQAPGMLHAYLHGAGLEAQANSDNTLRGGLTPKHVDVAELLKILDFEPAVDQIIEPIQIEDGEPCAGARTWRTPARSFALYDWNLDGTTKRELGTSGPSIVLCLHGEVTLMNSAGEMTLTKGESAYIASGEPQVSIHGTGRLSHVSVGQVPRSR